MRISAVTVPPQNYSINKNPMRNQVSTPVSQPIQCTEQKPVQFKGITTFLKKMFEPKDMNKVLNSLLKRNDILELGGLMHRGKISAQQLEEALSKNKDALALKGVDLEYCDYLINSHKAV